MCKAIEEMRNEAQNQAKYEEKMGIAVNMIADGSIPFEKIALLTGLSLEDVQELAASVAANA